MMFVPIGAVALLLLLSVAASFDTQLDTPLVVYGKPLLQKEFLLNYTNFNHGSFGSCPRSVLDHQAALRTQQEQQPDIWMRKVYRQLINETRREIANYIHVDVDSVVLVESASTAYNAILRSIAWHPGDILLYFSVAYGMVKSTAQYLKQYHGIELIEVPIEFPLRDGVLEFVDPMASALQSLKDESKLNRLRVVSLEHIVSVPAVREPIAELATLVKRYQPNCLVVVDGAHAMGQVRSLNLQTLAPMDAYLSNGHKWLYSPKGSAFLWVNASAVSALFPEPTVISIANQVGSSSLTQRFLYVSTRDYTATISMSKALEFRATTLGGEAAVYDYVHGLALSAKRHLMALWNVTAMAPDHMEDFMINIGLPIASVKEGTALQEWLLSEHEMYIVALHDPASGMFYTRLSAQVYLELDDFYRLGTAVLEFVENRKRRKYSDFLELE